MVISILVSAQPSSTHTTLCSDTEELKKDREKEIATKLLNTTNDNNNKFLRLIDENVKNKTTEEKVAHFKKVLNDPNLDAETVKELHKLIASKANHSTPEVVSANKLTKEKLDSYIFSSCKQDRGGGAPRSSCSQ